MKCLDCGAKIKRDEEICPECGAYISRDKKASASSVQTETKKEITVELLEKAIETTKKTDENKPQKYNFRDYLILPSIIRIGGGILLIIALIISFIKYPFKNEITTVLCFFFAGYIIFKGIASLIQERNCVLDVTSEKITGTIPLGFFDTEAVEINIGDIIAVNEKDFHSKRLGAEVHIVTKEKEHVVRSSSQTMLLDLSRTVRNFIKNQ